MSMNDWTRLHASHERLRVALEKIARGPVMPLPDPVAHSWIAFGNRAYAALRLGMRTAHEALSQCPPPAQVAPNESASQLDIGHVGDTTDPAQSGGRQSTGTQAQQGERLARDRVEPVGDEARFAPSGGGSDAAQQPALPVDSVTRVRGSGVVTTPTQVYEFKDRRKAQRRLKNVRVYCDYRRAGWSDRRRPAAAQGETPDKVERAIRHCELMSEGSGIWLADVITNLNDCLRAAEQDKAIVEGVAQANLNMFLREKQRADEAERRLSPEAIRERLTDEVLGMVAVVARKTPNSAAMYEAQRTGLIAALTEKP